MIYMVIVLAMSPRTHVHLREHQAQLVRHGQPVFIETVQITANVGDGCRFVVMLVPEMIGKFPGKSAYAGFEDHVLPKASRMDIRTCSCRCKASSIRPVCGSRPDRKSVVDGK